MAFLRPNKFQLKCQQFAEYRQDINVYIGWWGFIAAICLLTAGESERDMMESNLMESIDRPADSGNSS